VTDQSVDCVTTLGIRNVQATAVALRELHCVLRRAASRHPRVRPPQAPGRVALPVVFPRRAAEIGRMVSKHGAYSYLPQSVGAFRG
jgi:ubiquinone/menaquinone biosynthesis C-methylase UbiE